MARPLADLRAHSGSSAKETFVLGKEEAFTARAAWGARSAAWAVFETRSEAAREACQAKVVRLVGWLVEPSQLRQVGTIVHFVFVLRGYVGLGRVSLCTYVFYVAVHALGTTVHFVLVLRGYVSLGEVSLCTLCVFYVAM